MLCPHYFEFTAFPEAKILPQKKKEKPAVTHSTRLDSRPPPFSPDVSLFMFFIFPVNI